MKLHLTVRAKRGLANTQASLGERWPGRPVRSPCLQLAVVLGLSLCLLGLRNWAAAPREETPQPRRDFLTFKIISDRNIFNASRSRGSRGGSAQEAKPSRVDTFTLVGTMSYEKGPYAFFDGSSAEYRKVLEPGQSIADYKVTEVTGTGVTLEAGTNVVQLQVGSQMRREEDGAWEVVGNQASSSAAVAASSSTESPGEENDVVKRLMQQREQELK